MIGQKRRTLIRKHIRKISDVLDQINDSKIYLRDYLKQASLETGVAATTLRSVSEQYNRQSAKDVLEAAASIHELYFSIFDDSDEVID